MFMTVMLRPRSRSSSARCNSMGAHRAERRHRSKAAPGPNGARPSARFAAVSISTEAEAINSAPTPPTTLQLPGGNCERDRWDHAASTRKGRLVAIPTGVVSGRVRTHPLGLGFNKRRPFTPGEPDRPHRE